jgi:protein-tyrosine-phosphatase
MTQTHPPINVLFLCNSNCGRSLFAEAILNAEGAGRFRGFSAGTRPAERANPVAIDLLAKLGHDTGGLSPKDWSVFRAPDAPTFDFVFTLCDEAANEPCPVWPGNPVNGHWSIPAPSLAVGSDAEIYAAHEEAYRMIRQQLLLFISLPIRELDRMSLHHHVKGLEG